MEHQGQYGHGTTGTGRVDEYGNPVAGHGTGTGAMGMGTTGTGGMGMGTHGTGTGAGMGGQFQPTREEHKTGGILHRSGSSSSSSSSEDDGMGGRRKKGMKEKIKEKLPGGNKKQDEHQQMGTGTYGQHGHTGMTGTGTGTTGHETGEKKGVMDKIKEKLPGQH
jgi:hypothetical protein